MNTFIVTFLAVFFVFTSSQVVAGISETIISLPNNLGSATLYNSKDAKSANAGVIVVHEWWGLNQYAKD